MSETTSPKPTGTGLSAYRALVSTNANFRNLWFGQIISLLGDWFNLIASATLLNELTESGLAVGGLFVVRMLAPFLISPITGVVADRYNRKHILIVTDLLRAVIVLGFLFADNVPLLFTLTALQLAVSGFFFPARNAILPDVVESHELGTANALGAATWSTMLAFGAAIGGIVTGLVGTAPSFIIDALTFLASAYFVARVVYTPTTEPHAKKATLRAAFNDYVEGLRYLRDHLDILMISLVKAANGLFVSSVFTVLQVEVAEKVFVIGKNGGTGLGIVFAAVGIGTGFGPILARRFTGDRDQALRWGITAGYALTAVGLVIAAPLSHFGTFLIGAIIRGAGVGIAWVFSTQLLLQLAPNQVRGRIFATEFALYTLTYSIGASVGGALLESPAISISSIIWGMAALVLVPGIAWTWWIRRSSPPVRKRKPKSKRSA